MQKKNRKILPDSVKLVWFPVVAVIICCRLFLLPVFSGKQEWTLYALVNGIKEIRDPYLVMSSSFLGEVFRFLYSLTGRVPWYTLFLFLSGTFSLIAAGHVLLAIAGSVSGWEENISFLSVYLVFLAFFVPFLCSGFSGANTACALAAASGLLLFYAAFFAGRDCRLLFRILGFCAGALSCMLRFQMMVLCMAVIIIGCLVFFGTSSRLSPSGNRGFLISVIVCLLIFTGLYAADRYRYGQDPELTEYRKKVVLTQQLEDARMPDYETFKTQYQELGISKSAYDLYSGTGDFDSSVLTPEVMSELIRLQRRHPLKLSSLTAFFRGLHDKFEEKWYRSGFLILLGLYLVFGRKRSRVFAGFLGLQAAFWIIWYLLWCLQIFPVIQTEAGVLLVMSTVCMLWFFGDSDGFHTNFGVVLGICVLVCCAYFWRGDARSSNRFFIERRAGLYNILGVNGSDREHLYLRTDNVLAYENILDPFATPAAPVAHNTAYLGLQDVSFTGRKRMKEMFGVEHPYLDLIDNEKVYVIDDSSDWLTRYYRDQYGRKVRAEEVRKIDDRTVFRFITDAE